MRIENGVLKKVNNEDIVNGTFEVSNTVTSIGSFAFYYCTSLTSITIPDSVTSIGGYAFGECTNLTTIDIPDSVNYLGDFVFGLCINLKSVKIPNHFISLDSDWFDSYTNRDCIVYCNDKKYTVEDIRHYY